MGVLNGADLIYEFYRNGKLFRCFDSLSKATAYLAMATELCPEENFYLKTRSRFADQEA